MINKRMVSIIVCIALLCCIAPSVGAAKKTITILQWMQSPEAQARWDKLMEQFYELYPDIEVKPIRTNEYTIKLQTMVASGNPPDVAEARVQWEYAMLAPRGAFMDLQPYIEKSTVLSRDYFFDSAYDLFNMNGAQLGVPINANLTCIVYNKDMFDAEGLPYPDETWTWDDILQAALKLTKDVDGDGRVDQFGMVVPTWYFIHYLGSRGINLFNEDQTQFLFDTPEAIESVQWLADLWTKHKVAVPLAGAAAVGERDVAFGFESGKAAMSLDGTWSIADYAETIQAFDWDVTLLPLASPGAPRIATMITGSYVIPKKAKYPDEAWKLIEFLLSPEVRKGDVARTGEVPAQIPVANSAEFLSNPLPPADRTMWIRGLESARFFIEPVTVLGMELNREINQALDQVWIGKKTAAEVMPPLTKRMNEELAKMD